MNNETTQGKPNIWARRKARRALVQAVYEWQMSANNVADIRAGFSEGEALKKADNQFFDELLNLVVRNASDLDASFVGLLDRPLEQINPVERAILRLASAEFIHRIDVPYLVVIDEYVELAKTFGAQDSHKYINGVLDKLAKELRGIEVEAGKRG
jgi:transcription antitermination protein NusB